MSKVLITGGAGYIGSVLVPKVLAAGFEVRVLDLMLFGNRGLESVRGKCEVFSGEIRDSKLVERCLEDVEAVIHLASVANDPCADLDPKLTEAVNFQATIDLARKAKEKGVGRFIYSSTGSVYGVKKELNITEESSTNPITVYAKTKAESEKIVIAYNDNNFTTVALRPATTGGYSPRMRLDLVVNILTNQAVNTGKLIVHGGEQMRPSIDIQDITDYYVHLLNAPKEKIGGQVFNASCDNYKVMEIAETVRDVVGKHVELEVSETRDLRSYPMVSEKITRVLGLKPQRTLADTVGGLKYAFETGKIPNPENSIYRNIETMKKLMVR
ncbi:MAG: SDR family oxidoreductase [archaeon]|nr:SDR family oxidoreductase [archaeon]